MARPIVFLSDFGLDDEFVGICHGVIARIAPDSHVIDLTHGIPPQDMLRAALVLANSVRYAPDEAVYLGVVDPGVGTERRPIAAETASGHLTVGPDNGLFALVWDALGGPVRAVAIESEDVILRPTSATFHGRDVFSPAAAHLATGMPLDRLGPELPPDGLDRVSVPHPAFEQGSIRCRVLGVDRFGNAQLFAKLEHLRVAGLADERVLELRAGGRDEAIRRVATYEEIAQGLGLLVDSSGFLAVVMRGASAAGHLGLVAGDPVVLSSPRG
jgi:S-adenosyl-L-methionine hydrolase (adenosine-forming)